MYTLMINYHEGIHIGVNQNRIVSNPILEIPL